MIARVPLRCAAAVFGIALFAASIVARADPSVVVPPLALPGPYPVACSNVSQDFSRVAPGEDVSWYWEGVPRPDGSPRYVTDLLADPADTLTAVVGAPNDGNVYGSFAGQSLPYVVIVCYPTTPANPRPDYVLPTGRVVPHMQQGADPPLWPDASTRFPLIAFSHGFQGSPLSGDYIQAIVVLASFGYVVAAPFHGDQRIAPDLELSSLSDYLSLILHLRDFLALQALRPLSVSAMLDVLLARPEWRDRIDPNAIGGFGASLGGETMMLLGGAGLTTSLGFAWTPIVHDARIRAAAGYVPYFGQPFFPAFGRDQNGLNGVTLPFLAISGTADTTAPIGMTLLGLEHLAGPRELVALIGVPHGFDVASTGDIFTWTITFLDAEVRGDPAAQAKLAQMAAVAGGGDDQVVLPWNGAAGAANYSGVWWDPAEPGWALDVTHEGDVVYAAWLTHDVSGRSLWLSLVAARSATGTFSGPIIRTSGPPFTAAPYDPALVAASVVGSGTLAFSGGSGTFSYTVGGVAATKPIVPFTFGPAPQCVFGGLSDLSLATNYQGLWWNAPAGSEPGWAVSIAHDDDALVATLLVYDLDGAPLWLSAFAPRLGAGTYAGTLYRTTGSSYGAPFDPAATSAAAVGTATFAFTDGNHGTLAYTIGGAAQKKTITRDVLVAPGTVCQ